MPVREMDNEIPHSGVFKNAFASQTRDAPIWKHFEDVRLNRFFDPSAENVVLKDVAQHVLAEPRPVGRGLSALQTLILRRAGRVRGTELIQGPIDLLTCEASSSS